MAEPFVSVIVPVFDEFKYFDICLDSLLAQTLREIEIIIVDDGSSGAFVSHLRYRTQEDPRIRLILKDHQGPGAARNTGMRSAKGDYIVFVDADDVPANDYCNSLLSIAENEGSDFVVSRYSNFCEKGTECASCLGSAKTDAIGFIKGLYMGLVSMGICAKLFRKEIILSHEIWFPAEILSEERHFLLRYIYHSKHISLLDKVIYQRRIHSESTMAKFTLRCLPGMRELLNLDISFVGQKGLGKELNFHILLAHYRVLAHAYVHLHQKYEIASFKAAFRKGIPSGIQNMTHGWERFFIRLTYFIFQIELEIGLPRPYCSDLLCHGLMRVSR